MASYPLVEIVWGLRSGEKCLWLGIRRSNSCQAPPLHVQVSIHELAGEYFFHKEPTHQFWAENESPTQMGLTLISKIFLTKPGSITDQSNHMGFERWNLLILHQPKPEQAANKKAGC